MEKKLTLKKEVLKKLSAQVLRNVAGGVADLGLGPSPLSDVAGTFEGCNVL